MEQKSPMSEVYGSGSGPTPQNNPSKDTKNFLGGALGFIWEIIKIILIAAIIVFPIRYFLFQPFIVKGDSMVPNLHSGNYLIVDEISYRFNSPKRGDVVVLKYPLDPDQRFIKRVIGLPGETIQVKNNKIFIIKDGKSTQLDESAYLPESSQTLGSADITLKADQYFVMGDNRPFSYDSRSWGALPKEDIIGKAILRIFPVSEISYIHAPNY